MADKESRAPAPWDPFSEWDLLSGLAPLRDPGFWSSRLAKRLGEGGGEIGRLAPSVDIAENEDAFVITAELPGSSKDDINVEVHDRVLTLRGEKRNEREGKDENARWTERSYGRFSRSFTLPANAATDRIRADFEGGVLTIEVPKLEQQKPQVVSIS